MPDRNQERTALAQFIDSVRLVRSADLAILKHNPEDLPNVVLFNPIDATEIRVEIVQAVEFVELLAAERRAQRLRLPGGGRWAPHLTGRRRTSACSRWPPAAADTARSADMRRFSFGE